MNYETLEGVRFDVSRLIDHYERSVKPLPMYEQPGLGGNGGWSVLSQTGSYLDGWHMGARCFSDESGNTTYDSNLGSKLGVLKPHHYINPTEICCGYLAEVIQTIHSLGLQPMRARIALMKPGQDTRWHRDAAGSTYLVRLHIPIITDEKVLWCTPDSESHLPADGRAYLVAVNQMHLVKNLSEIDRVHLYMDVRDTRGITKNFRWEAPSAPQP